MRSIHNYIIHVPNQHDDRIETDSGLVLYKNTGMAEGFDFVREGEVVLDCEFDKNGIQIGDIIYFHHHVCTEEINHEGVREPSDYMIDMTKRWYKVPVDICYGYTRDGVFTANDGFCFLEPEMNYQIDPKKYPNIIIPNNEQEAISIGKIKYSCPSLESMGVTVGDLVYFSDYSKYPMKILGENLYRMEVDWILGKA